MVICYVGGMLSFNHHVPVLLLNVGKASVVIHCQWHVKFLMSCACVVPRCWGVEHCHSLCR